LSGIADHLGTSAAPCCQVGMYKCFCRALSAAAGVVAYGVAHDAQAEPLSRHDSAAMKAWGWPNYHKSCSRTVRQLKYLFLLCRKPTYGMYL